MATRSSLLAWESLWTEEPGGLQFMGSLRVGHDLATEEKYQQQGVIAPSFSIGILTFLNDLFFFFPPILQVIQLPLNRFFFFFWLRFSRESLLPKAIDFYN